MDGSIATPDWEACETCKHHAGPNGCNLAFIDIEVHRLGDWIICQDYNPKAEEGKGMKLHPPEKCPWCLAPLSGGGEHTVYYKCGSHIWLDLFGYLHGHPGDCESEDQGKKSEVCQCKPGSDDCIERFLYDLWKEY